MKITGMMLELRDEELLILLQNEHLLKEKVEEALKVLKERLRQVANFGGTSGSSGRAMQAGVLMASVQKTYTQQLTHYSATVMNGENEYSWLGLLTAIISASLIILACFQARAYYNHKKRKMRPEATCFYLSPTGKKLHCTPECKTLQHTRTSSLRKLDFCSICCVSETREPHRSKPEPVKGE